MAKDSEVQLKLRFDSEKLSRSKVVELVEYAVKPFGVEVWTKDA